ncbi:MAG: iron-containing alcohol dehydrogenase, partial [Pseudomonadota bacterium]
LVAGMGDAMATWYEARVCLDNPQARTTIGARPTLASCAMGEICAHTLFDEGVNASKAVVANEVNDSLEMVVEANTLLSGIGFESGGLAVAHGIAQSYPSIPEVHANYLHGEMVAMGLVTQLMINNEPEAKRVAKFFASVGLPIHLGQISLGPEDQGAIDTVAEVTVGWPNVHNMPVEITPAVLKKAILGAHELGVAVAKEEGDSAYRRIQAN